MLGVTALVAGAGALAVVSVLGARRPEGGVPDRDGFLDSWSDLHLGYDPRGNLWVRGWLRGAYRVARPLAAVGLPPDVLTLWGLWLAGAAAVAAAVGQRWPLAAAGLVVASGLLDTLDGAVAALTDRATPAGSVLDSVADRAGDVAFLAAVWLAGGPGGLAVGCGILIGLLEYTRARAGNAGMDEVGVVTVGERPVRVICCAGALTVAGAAPALAGPAATAGLGVLLVLSAAGLLQLAAAVRRILDGDVEDFDEE